MKTRQNSDSWKKKYVQLWGKNDDHLPSYEILVHGETDDQVYMPFF